MIQTVLHKLYTIIIANPLQDWPNLFEPIELAINYAYNPDTKNYSYHIVYGFVLPRHHGPKIYDNID
jgi:hypothetical protein